MSDFFYGVDIKNAKSNHKFYSTNEGVYFLPYLYEKHLNPQSSKVFSFNRVESTIKFILKGYVPNLLLKDFDEANKNYLQLANLFKLE
jgi:hypothetical protein